MTEREQGIDPFKEEIEQGDNTFGAVAEAFITEKLPEKARAYGDANDIRRLLLGGSDYKRIPSWRDKPISKIEIEEVIALIEAWKRTPNKRTGKPMVKSAFDALTLTNRIFKWAVGRGKRFGVRINPAREVDVKSELGERELTGRALDDHEVRAYWLATEKMDFPAKQVLQLLLLTGARISEITQARWSWFNEKERTLTVPKRETKMKQGDNVIPLVPAAVEIIKSLPQCELPAGSNVDPPLFPGNDPGEPYQGWNKVRPKLYAGMREIAAVKAFRPHDVRHTIKTWMVRNKVPMDVSEAVLHHTKKGMDAVYNHHQYGVERRKQLELWKAEIDRIIKTKMRPPKTTEARVAT